MKTDDIWKFRGWFYTILIGALIAVAIYKYTTREEPVLPPFINAQGWPPDLVPHPHIPEPEKPDFPPPGFPNARTSDWC